MRFKSEATQHMHGVAADLDARAESGELLRLLIDGNADAGLAQSRGRGEAAHAGADDGDIQGLHAAGILARAELPLHQDAVEPAAELEADIL